MQELQALIEPKAKAPERPIINSGWHIVLCEPNRELSATSGMTARGFEVCCPCDYTRRKTGKRDVAGRPILSIEPSPKAMIPGYVFVRFKAGKDPDYDGVKAVPGVRNFYRLVSRNVLEPRYAGLRDAEIADLRLADALAFEKFQESVLPKAKQKPAVEFESGKAVRFTTKFGKEIFGQMQEKHGGGMVKVIADNASYLVPHFDLEPVVNN